MVLKGASSDEFPAMPSSEATPLLKAMPSSGEDDPTAGHQPRIRISLEDMIKNLALYFKQYHNLSIEGKERILHTISSKNINL